MQQLWSIGIFEGSSPLDLKPSDPDPNPVLTRSDVSDVPAHFVADPFIVRAAGQWYMFFEVMNQRSGKGEIGLATSTDGRRWTYQSIVLTEPFHLSYPYVFEHDGEHYMVPESYMTRSVRLYRATAFPGGWSHVTELVEGAEFVDPSIWRWDDRWWMFAGVGTRPFRADTLRLFSAPEIMGPWAEHAQSPIVKNDAQHARPAGRVVVWQGRIVRYAQDCRLRYGAQVHAFEMTRLTDDAYSELPVATPLLRGAEMGWNQGGMHHIDPHPLGGGSWIAAVDGWRDVPA